MAGSFAVRQSKTILARSCDAGRPNGSASEIIDAAFNFAWSYFVNVMEAQTESGVVAQTMSSRSLAKPSRSQILPGLSQAQAK
jgi:hypothetical protein